MKTLISPITAWYKKYERYLVPITLVSGFLIDVITFKTIQFHSALLLLVGHMVFLIMAIVYSNIQHNRTQQSQNNIGQLITFITPFILQISLGALLSAALLFYSFSSAITVSWPLLLVVVILMISSERFTSTFRQPLVQFPVLYFVLFLIGGVGLPFLFSSLHPIWFFVSGVISFGLVFGLVLGLGKWITFFKEKRNIFAGIMGGIFLSMSGLYLLNIIPPVPLSVYDSGVYHHVQRVGDTYEFESEVQSLVDRLRVHEHITDRGGRIYVFTAIVAPGKIQTDIVHHWQKWDEKNREWKTRNAFPFPIFGGRKEGYRGYSYSGHVEPGKWRVQVETPRGQVLGRKVFVVDGAVK